MSPGTKDTVLSIGELVYVKKAKRHANQQNIEFNFNDPGVCILLGSEPEGGKDWSQLQVVRSQALIGFMYMEDVKEFLGQAAFVELVEKFQTKYYPKRPTIIAPSPSKILGMTGLPLAKPNEPKP